MTNYTVCMGRRKNSGIIYRISIRIDCPTVQSYCIAVISQSSAILLTDVSLFGSEHNLYKREMKRRKTDLSLFITHFHTNRQFPIRKLTSVLQSFKWTFLKQFSDRIYPLSSVMKVEKKKDAFALHESLMSIM